VAFPGGLTYSGHPLACAAGVATFEVFDATASWSASATSASASSLRD
jgi:adenosylmethionine-8-amino-7-oxononanoate aminotransferase